jgi:hypothetical protein
MEDQIFIGVAAILLGLLQFALHWFLKWRLRIDPVLEQSLEAQCSPEFLKHRRRLTTSIKIQSHIGMVFGPWLCMFMAVMSTDSPDHPKYAPYLVGSVMMLISYLLFLELPIHATRLWLRLRTTAGAWTSGANIALNLWCTPFWIVFPFQIYFLARTLFCARKENLEALTESPDAQKALEGLE